MIRKAEWNDCEAVYRLICDMESSPLPFERFSEIFREQLGRECFRCLVEEQDGRVIAVLNLRFENQLHHAERIAEIIEFAVDPAYRNKGLGKQMLESACRIAKDCGCMQIEVACNRLRTDTHRFYLSAGMHNFHYKFSKSLTGADSAENAIGR